ncbi:MULTISPECIES: hypothetical protein [Acinetobacter]|uniref:hypothetical protein n=1 Tax=Acinetobacter TaxID=469 RepID=UPI002004622E|nr:hypothetical protein [Acinetobacter radioresistens]MCK4082176.1 hypothetical protein [Acinetobacter radioresistens]MCK4107937.1 hypothetical protein [Acinetobacter radioresistens]MCU4499962.1 hypothetical protein [Acinetobacter radioresistens]
MRPISRKVMPSTNFLHGDYYQNLGKSNTVGKIRGSVKRLGSGYENAKIVIYDKASLLPILVKKPNTDGSYHFLGLNRDMRCFIAAFDNNQQFNAVIQDNVVPK